MAKETTGFNSIKEDIICSYSSNLDEYQILYKNSIEDPEQFWGEVAQQLFWKNQPKNVLDGNLDIGKGRIFISIMKGALTNVCYNVLDRNIERGLGDNIAYHWEGNDGKSKRRITYTELRREVCKFANALKGLNIKKGDRIAIYMPVSIECVVAMLACARIGAVHSVMFAGFAPDTLATRMIDARCVLLISSDGCYRAEKLIPLKIMTDSALNICTQRGYQKISNIVYKHLKTQTDGLEGTSGQFYTWNDQVDICWDDFIKDQSDVCEPEWVDGEHPLFTLYTSGSTGKAKGIVHSCGGFLIYVYYLSKHVFDIKFGDVFFSTSDMGWASAHFHTVYGGLALGATNVLMEGKPIYPNPDRIWEIIDRLQVKVFYTAPTLLRILMKSGDHYVKAYKRNSLRLLATTGEPLNPEAWLWYWKVVGDGRCPIVDTYGQTETGATMVANIPGSGPMKSGPATLPFFGIVPAVLDHDGNEIEGPCTGHLVYKTLWPGMAQTIDGNHDLFESTYFQKFAGYYWTGDGVRRDSDGYYWITGRIDDTINVSGHLLSTAELENAITEHRAIVEAVSASAPHSVKGEVPIVFVVLNNEYVMTPELELEIKNKTREKIGAHAQPEMIIAVNGLPRTRSGKVMRRILQNIVRNESELGDTSTMEDESVLIELKAIQQKIKLS